VSDASLDALAESARNRGLKLVRSRVRTPKKRRFGKVGLTDPSGKPLFGMDAKGPTATPEDVEAYLRTLGAKDWGASLGVAVPPKKRKKPAKPKAPPPPPPKPQVRAAKALDAPAITELIHVLGHKIDEKAVRKNLKALAKIGETPLVAAEGKRIIGVIGIHTMVTVHRPARVGRIPMLVVARDAQGRGIGKMLVNAVERLLRKAGCQLVEVTSNDRRADAHAFYRHLGYERTSTRFMKKL
jgi:GNAT superfamily N-acetyltransferase